MRTVIIIKFKFFIKGIIAFSVLTFVFICSPVSMAGKDDVNVNSPDSVSSSEPPRSASSGAITESDPVIARHPMKRANTQTDVRYAQAINRDFQYGRQRNRIIKLAFNDLCKFLKEISC